MSNKMLDEGRYELLEEVGSGGMATVYRAMDHRLKVIRAVKILDPQFAHKAEIRHRFEVEAQAMARLEHPNIVQLYDVQLDGDELYIVMEFIDGSSLLEAIEAGAIDVLSSLDVTIEVLRALQVAHTNGIVHRDIKPHNILLDKENQVWVSDFGIARCVGSTDMSLTRTGVVMGTWAFMAPEQRSDAKGVDHLADIYSVGATMYAMITGETPKDLFAAEIDPTMFRDIPTPIESLIRRACAYWTTDRYPSAAAMLTDVEFTRRVVKQGDAGERNFDIRFRTDPGQLGEGPPPAQPLGPAGAALHPKSKAQQPQARRTIPPEIIPASKGSSGWTIGGGLLLGFVLIVVWVARDVMDRFGIEEVSSDVAAVPQIEHEGRGDWEYGGDLVIEKPHIDHAVPDGIEMGETLFLDVEIPGTTAYDQVWAFYRPVGIGAEYSRASFRRKGDGYRGDIATDRLMQDGLEYYIEAHAYHQGMAVLRHGSSSRPNQVEVLRH